MRTHSLAVVLLLVIAFCVAAQVVQAQGPEPPGDTHRPFDPAEWQPGRPLPGAGYPWRRVSRLAPTGWVPAAPPAGVDLDVTYINRTPMHKMYCVQYPGGIPTLCPGTENDKRWPSPGETLTFTAHIVNKGTQTSPAFAYKWFMDGTEVASGTHPGLAPGAEGIATYQWAWAHTMDGERVVDDHKVRFTVDPANVISETYESNNSLEDRTNAMSFRLAITPAMYEAYNTPWNPAFSYSAEDWLQRQITAINWAFANSTYAAAPQGATERVRINSIEITSISPVNDWANDGGWFVDGDYRSYSAGYDPTTDIDWNLVHELSHQVGLIDLYNLNLSATSVQVLDQQGIPANVGFSWPRWDLMGGGDIAPHTDHHLYSSHSAAAISSTKGYRRGYYGEYQYDIPQQNYLQVLDSQGNPANAVQVTLYQRNGPVNWMGEQDVDNTPEISGTTGSDGGLLLTNRSVGGGTTTHSGHTLRNNPFGVLDVVGKQNRFLVKLNKADHEEFAWLDITSFNLAYWQGDTISHTFIITSHVPPVDAIARPVSIVAQVEGNRAALCWGASPSTQTVGYYVYRAGPPTCAYARASGLVTGLCYTDTYDGGNRVYAVTAVDGSSKESAFGDSIWAPRLLNPYAVGISAGGNRVILDPQNGYALLRQRSDGRYTQNFGSPHYHLEYSYFMSIDGQDRLLFSHPGDYYTTRHSVRIADQQANPVLEFGQRGSGPGQFQTPAGVAVFGKSCTIEGPYTADARTLLLLHFDGNYTGAQGETGTANGTTFSMGRYGQGVLVDGSDTLIYPTTGNISRTQGSIEFWLKPQWDGSDGRGYVFFEVGSTWFNRMRIAKDGANNLRFMLWDSSKEYGVAYNVAHWRAGEWHHVAATWEGDRIRLLVDGQERSGASSIRPPDSLAASLFVGSPAWGSEQANAIIDEFRISDSPRIGNSDTCAYRILVADSGNNRLQAFDGQGNFVSTYGTPGSGPGQFNNPQELAVGDGGRVIVADKGNNRLQILSFDGANFGFTRIVTAGFNNPTGIAAYGADRILVADTGNNKVKVLDAEGSLLAEYAAPNDGSTGNFNQPRGVIADGYARIIVADTGNRRVVTILSALPARPPTGLTVSGPTAGLVQGGNTFTATVSPVTATLPITYIWQATGQLPVTHSGDVSDTIVLTWNAPGMQIITVTVSGPGGSDTVAKARYINVLYGVYLPVLVRDR